MRTESTHVHPLRGVGEARHPGTDVHLHADHWDQTQEPDILDHVGPLCQPYSLNLQKQTWQKITGDQKSLCVCVSEQKGGNRQMRSAGR